MLFFIHLYLLGGSVCVNTPIFFSRNHGLISVSSNDLLSDLNISQTLNSQIENSFTETAANNLTIYNLDPDDVSNAHKDTLGQFKAAFIFHVKRQQVIIIIIISTICQRRFVNSYIAGSVSGYTPRTFFVGNKHLTRSGYCFR